MLDVAAEAPDELMAIAVMSEAVRARRTTAARLLTALSSRSRIPRRQFLASVLRDVADGTCSVSCDSQPPDDWRSPLSA